MIHIADVNEVNQAGYQGAQVYWEPDHLRSDGSMEPARFRFCLVRYDGGVEEDADDPERYLFSWEQLLIHAAPLVDWDSQTTKDAFIAAEEDRKQYYDEEDPRLKRIIPLLSLTA